MIATLFLNAFYMKQFYVQEFHSSAFKTSHSNDSRETLSSNIHIIKQIPHCFILYNLYSKTMTQGYQISILIKMGEPQEQDYHRL